MHHIIHINKTHFKYSHITEPHTISSHTYQDRVERCSSNPPSSGWKILCACGEGHLGSRGTQHILECSLKRVLPRCGLLGPWSGWLKRNRSRGKRGQLELVPGQEDGGLCVCGLGWGSGYGGCEAVRRWRDRVRLFCWVGTCYLGVLGLVRYGGGK